MLSGFKSGKIELQKLRANPPEGMTPEILDKIEALYDEAIEYVEANQNAMSFSLEKLQATIGKANDLVQGLARPSSG